MKISWLSRLLLGGGARYLPAPDADGEIAVLVHGLIRRGRNLLVLGRRLNRAGFAVHIYDYETTTKTIAEHGRDFKLFLEKLAAENPERKIHIVTHSMGGIITREALGHPAGAGEILTSERIGRIVMLAPPNQGSDAARRAVRWMPFIRTVILPLAELSSAPEAYIHRVPVPDGIDIGIIAGRFDLEVRLNYTRLPAMRAHIPINAEHSFMVYLPKVAKLVVRYLREGRFTD